ncbi:ATP-binding cassette domain-containing protein [Planctellipticum variicoloris]|uniref:ABC transporter ATP-binding protein n=1 Tax=Planctellipticum variicoloris TaxID=3064265 RepID=UPI003013E3AE|nr:ABC transporter ATP-binding protein [Planctomycetaceae bacterium SH412]
MSTRSTAGGCHAGMERDTIFVIQIPAQSVRTFHEACMIELQNITQHYGVRPILKDLSLEIPPGQVVAIVGPNGMGKSTLLGVIAGTLTPQKGHVLIGGLRRRASVDDELAIRRQAVYLPDRPWLPGSRTGREYLLAVGRLYGVDDDRLMEHVDRLLEVFEIKAIADSPIRSYSNGQQKKTALAGVLATEAPTLLLDEPFGGGLDPSGILVLKHILRHRVVHEKKTVIMTTPVPELLDELADRIIILKQGAVIADGSPMGLRRQLGVNGPLDEVLARLLHPQSLEQLDAYFRDLPR